VAPSPEAVLPPEPVVCELQETRAREKLARTNVLNKPERLLLILISIQIAAILTPFHFSRVY